MPLNKETKKPWARFINIVTTLSMYIYMYTLLYLQTKCARHWWESKYMSIYVYMIKGHRVLLSNFGWLIKSNHKKFTEDALYLEKYVLENKDVYKRSPNGFIIAILSRKYCSWSGNTRTLRADNQGSHSAETGVLTPAFEKSATELKHKRKLLKCKSTVHIATLNVRIGQLPEQTASATEHCINIVCIQKHRSHDSQVEIK